MKKAVITSVFVLLVLAAGCGALGFAAYSSADETSVPAPTVTAAGQVLEANAWQWRQPVLWGLFEKAFSGGAGGSHELGALGPAGLGLALPEGYQAQLALSHNGVQLYAGAAGGFNEALAAQPGGYALAVECTRQPVNGEGHGSFGYTLVFSLPEPEPEPPPPPEPEPEPSAEPTLATGAQTLQQGDIFSMRLAGLAEGVVPTANTPLGYALFTPTGDGAWYAAVPVGNRREPGEYAVAVQAGDNTWELAVTVEKYNFVEENLVIDVTDPVISEANSPAAYQQYNETIVPLFYTWDEQRYWNGFFIRPVEGGWISTEFGTIRYTNGDYSTSRSHNGMDFAVGEGTPIMAPNHGRVVLAEYLLNTGWTIVIEHGGALKSLYFHMIELYVQPGDMVRQGDIIGAVGTTGYSTGNHLHFETRIGDQAVSPSMLFEETAGLYGAELEAAAE